MVAFILLLPQQSVTLRSQDGIQKYTLHHIIVGSVVIIPVTHECMRDLKTIDAISVSSAAMARHFLGPNGGSCSVCS